MNKTFQIFTVVMAISSVALLSGCASRIGGNNYAVAGVGESMTSYVGTVIAKRQVQVNESQRPGEGGAGAGIGAVAGGVAGSAIGNGTGQVAASIGGALLGGVLGAVAEENMTTQSGFEYTVQLDNGAIKTIVQGVDIDMPVGQRVLFHESHKGARLAGQARSRIVPFNG